MDKGSSEDTSVPSLITSLEEEGTGRAEARLLEPFWEALGSGPATCWACPDSAPFSVTTHHQSPNVLLLHVSRFLKLLPICTLVAVSTPDNSNGLNSFPSKRPASSDLWKCKPEKPLISLSNFSSMAARDP